MNSTLKCLSQVTNYLNVPAKNITINNDNLASCTIKNVAVKGFINIILNSLKQNNSEFTAKNLLEEAEIRQWLEYCLIFGLQNKSSTSLHQLIKTLNRYLEIKTYFVGQRLTIVDVLIFYTIQEFIENLPHLDKEKYLNVSRWFDNIQQQEKIRMNKNLVDFSTIFLVSAFSRY